MDLWKRWKLQMVDALRNNARVRRLAATAMFGAGLVRRGGSSTQTTVRLKRLCLAASACPNSSMQTRIEREIDSSLERVDASQLDWECVFRDARTPVIRRGVILKPYMGDRERGVIAIAFEEDLVRLVNADLDRLAKEFVVVFSPTCSPPHHLVVAAFPRMFHGDVFCTLSNLDDAAMIPRISKRYTVLPMFASSWVNPDEFVPLPWAQRDIDLLMVANFGLRKRHFAFFRALRDMPSNLRIVLVGQDQDGRTSATVRDEARLYGVGDRIEVHSDLSHQEVASMMCRARATTVFSVREGSCLAVAESMFAGAPVALLTNATIGSKAFINDRTGRLIDPAEASTQLRKFIESADRYSPREWALENISCHVSSERLNGILRDAALQRYEDWTQDIATLCRHPVPRLFRESDHQRLASEYVRVKDEIGVEFPLK